MSKQNQSNDAPTVPLLTRMKLGGGGLFLGLLLGLGVAGWQMFVGQAALEAAETTAASRIGELETAIDLANGRAHVLRARVDLARAHSELAKENYGAAKTALDASRASLAKATPQSSGTTAERLGNASAALGALSVDSSVGLEAQLQAFGSAASALDALLAG